MSFSEDSTYSFSEKLEFDDLLFTTDHTLLESFTQTLVKHNSNKACSNTNIILRYYFSHARVMELLLWAFEKELTENPPGTTYFPFQCGSSIFISFYREYSKLFLKQYLNDALSPIITTILDENTVFDISVLQGPNNDTNNDDEPSSVDQSYNQTLQTLTKLVEMTNNNIVNSLALLPQHFSILIQKLVARLELYEGKAIEMFKTLLYQYTIAPVFIDPTIISYQTSNSKLIIANMHKLSFFRETLLETYGIISTSEHSYIKPSSHKALNTSMDILTCLTQEVEYEEVSESTQQQSILYKDFNKMIKENIQTIIDYLPRQTANKLLSNISVDSYVLDDYHVYHTVIESINKYCMCYNRRLQVKLITKKSENNALIEILNKLRLEREEKPICRYSDIRKEVNSSPTESGKRRKERKRKSTFVEMMMRKKDKKD
ncbi:Ras-GAP domain-containing protein [Entamoeba marina]